MRRHPHAGASRVITQDAGDLKQFGWSRTAGSFSTSGAGTWEVCDGTNFSGHCRTLSGSNGAVPALAAMSARRVSTGQGDVMSPIAVSLQNALTFGRVEALTRAH